MGTFRPYTYSLLLIPFLAFCQWDGSDSDMLANIERDVDDISQDVGWIRSYAASDKATLESINQTLSSVNSKADSIISNTEKLTSLTFVDSDSGPAVSGQSLLVRDYDLENAVGTNSTRIVNALSSISSSGFPTNYLALQLLPYLRRISNVNRTFLEKLFSAVYGRLPSNSELDNLVYLYQNFGSGFEGTEDLFLHVPTNNVLRALGPVGTPSRTAFTHSLAYYTQSLTAQGLSVSERDAMRLRNFAYSQLRSFEYGTRELTDSFELLTNTLLRVGSDIDFDSQALFTTRSRGASVSSLSDVPTLGFADATTNTFFSIANSALPSVTYDSSLGTNTPGYHDFSAAVLDSAEHYSYEPTTNNITPLEWGDFASFKTDVENQTPNHPDAFSGFWNDSDKLPIVDEVSSWDAQSSDFSLPFDLPYLFLSSHNTTTRNLVVHNATAYTRPYITFFVAVIKVIIATFFINRIYNFILKTVAAVEET